jgi:DNA-binding Lrp family transcriptional regulator
MNPILDELDSALLMALQADGRRTNRDLADLLGVAPSTALERVRSLRGRGVITGTHATVDLAVLGRPIRAMITVRVRPQNRQTIHGFRDYAAALPETLDVFITTGFEDVLMHVGLPSTAALQDFVLDRLTTRKEIADIRTSVVFEHVRTHVIRPV